jgi:hypothetical protein
MTGNAVITGDGERPRTALKNLRPVCVPLLRPVFDPPNPASIEAIPDEAFPKVVIQRRLTRAFPARRPTGEVVGERTRGGR